MKKLVFAAVAAIALTASVSFVSCNNAPKGGDDTISVDSTVVEDTVSFDSIATDSVALDSVN
ncbi:MAG: entericidin [Bacteroidales bacterium]|nr:entericidin [Bacteroidales bacterium]